MGQSIALFNGLKSVNAGLVLRADGTQNSLTGFICETECRV